MNKKLNEGLNTLNIKLDDSQIQKLNGYIQEVIAFNQTYNLMKADTEDELAINHILDSLCAYHHLNEILLELSNNGQKEISVADIGSGGGCPGIPLSIAFPQYNFTLVERMEKRCAFLESTKNKLHLDNVKVFCTQADKVPKNSFDLQVFRAFHPFDKKIAALLLGMAKPGSYIAAYKARSEKIAAEMETVQNQIPEYKKIPLTVPFLEDHERNLVVVKVKSL